MEEVTGNEAEKAREQYENFFIELIREEDLLPSQRNQDYFDDTCKLFLDRGLSQSDHVSWRSKKMVPEMRSLLHETHKAMNPWKYDEYIVNIPWPDPEESTSPEEFPVFNRQELEILAAQEFLFRSQEYSPQKNNAGETLHAELENEKIETVAVKMRQGNLVDVEAKDLVSSGLSAQEIVNHWKEQCCDSMNTDEQLDNDDLLIKLSNAASRAKKAWKRDYGNDLRLPLRIHRTMTGQWHKYALTEEGAPGAGGGNKYGIIDEDKNN